jgi:hypothetical protein
MNSIFDVANSIVRPEQLIGSGTLIDTEIASSIGRRSGYPLMHPSKPELDERLEALNSRLVLCTTCAPLPAPQDPISALRHTVTDYTTERQQNIDIWYTEDEKSSNNALYWGSGHDPTRTNRLPVSKIARVLIGKQTAAWERPNAKAVSIERALSIVSVDAPDGSALDVEFADRTKRTIFLDALEQIIVASLRIISPFFSLS